jgi:hypothetical protein
VEPGLDEPKRTAPMLGDDAYLQHLFAAFAAGHVTEQEWHQGSMAHRLLVAAEAAA